MHTFCRNLQKNYQICWYVMLQVTSVSHRVSKKIAIQAAERDKICSSKASFARKSNLNFCQISYWRDRALTECVPSYATILFVFTTWHGLNYYTKVRDHRSKQGPAELYLQTPGERNKNTKLSRKQQAFRIGNCHGGRNKT